jgi:prepilin-type N-terminal cleavage/methylation domain-containing protein
VIARAAEQQLFTVIMGSQFGIPPAHSKATLIKPSHPRVTGASAQAAFTLVEAVVAISILGIAVAYIVGTLTKFNAFAATARNSTGAYSIVMNQVDLFLSIGPFNPSKGEIPAQTESTNNPSNLPTYDMSVGTHTIGCVYKDGTGTVTKVDDKWPVYQYIDPTNGQTIAVKGTLTLTITDISATVPNSYQATVTLTYDYLNRTQANGKPYTLSMSAIRTSDT